jgi:hypothetical protein
VILPRDAWNLLDGDILRWHGQEAPDFAFLENMAEVRGIVEPAAARLAAARRTETDHSGGGGPGLPARARRPPPDPAAHGDRHRTRPRTGDREE